MKFALPIFWECPKIRFRDKRNSMDVPPGGHIIVFVFSFFPVAVE